MTEREWFAVQDPLVLLAFVQEHSGVALLKGSPRDSKGAFPDFPTSLSGWRMRELYRAPIEPGREKEAELVRPLHRYLLACCRSIWPLLRHESSRLGVEVTELYIEGKATDEEWGRAESNAEGAAFFLEFQPHEPDCSPDLRETYLRIHADNLERFTPERREAYLQYETDRREQIEQMVREVAALPAEEMSRMVRAVPTDEPLTPRNLLHRAAYFVDTAINYAGIRPLPGVIERYPEFLSADLLRRHVRYPLHARTPGPGHVWWARYGTKA